MKIILILIIICAISQQIKGDSLLNKYPISFSWDDYENTSLITSMQSQKSPHSCGSCWAMASAQALSDRIKIKRFQNRRMQSQRNNTEYSISDSETILSSQVLLSCDNYQAYGCYGGQIREVYRWVKENNITDETCAPYQAKGEKEESDKICNASSFCTSCNISTSECGPVSKYKYFNLDDYGFISGEENMITEIYQRGPIVCYMRTDSNFDFKYHHGIYIDTSGSNSTDHAVSILGWGQQYQQDDDGENKLIKYWIIRNTYGSFWGDGGFMKILRGSNNAGIEKECVWATPDISSTQETRVANTTVFMDWRNVNATNFVSPLRNLLSPKLCNNISWAEAALSSLEDRININSQKVQKRQKIPIRLSLQSVINCINNGKCWNRDLMSSVEEVYEMAMLQGIPDESCNSFEGEVTLDENQDSCNGVAQCKYCYLPHYPFTHMDDNCTSLPSDFVYKRYFASSFNRIHLHQTRLIQKEIEQNGPIACPIKIDQTLIDYQGGIYNYQEQNEEQSNYRWITLIGWGYDHDVKQEFWIAKNSWGTSWGENGFFRMNVKSTQNQDRTFSCVYPNVSRHIQES